MKKITNEMIVQAYTTSKKIFENKITLNDGIEYLITNVDMNEASARDYINNYKNLRYGKKYSRTMNEFATRYYLQHIYEDEGSEGLKKALSALEQHLKYYEDLRDVTMKGLHSIHNEFSELLIKNQNIYLEENEKEYVEGKAKKVFVNIYERDSKARKRCVELYGYKCSACGVLLSDKYGFIGKNFIHIHHLKELSSIKKEYMIDPENDLRPLCPNCHTMIHRKNPAYTIEELKQKMETCEE